MKNIRVGPYDLIRIQTATFVAVGTVAMVACSGQGDFGPLEALFPREERRAFEPNLVETRMVPGTRIGLVRSSITPDDPHVSTLTHELLHTLGLAHSNPRSATTPVPGTRCNPAQSLLRPGGADELHADDIETIDIPFSPFPGESCVYRREFRRYGGRDDCD